jgi:hypothetical protein
MACSYELKCYFVLIKNSQKHTLAVRGLEEHNMRNIICEFPVSFMLFTVLTLANRLYFEEFLIHDSRGFMILKNN